MTCQEFLDENDIIAVVVVCPQMLKGNESQFSDH